MSDQNFAGLPSEGGVASFAAYIEQERERLAKARQELRRELAAIENDLVRVDRESAAITAYETAKLGKPLAKWRVMEAVSQIFAILITLFVGATLARLWLYGLQ